MLSTVRCSARVSAVVGCSATAVCVLQTPHYSIKVAHKCVHSSASACTIYRVYCVYHDQAILSEHPNYVNCYLRLSCIARDTGNIHEASRWFKQVSHTSMHAATMDYYQYAVYSAVVTI
jgi:hypothetical protein